MKRGILGIATAVVFFFTASSCILDPKKEEGPTTKTPPPAFKDLALARDNVLFNLKEAYEQRNLNEYDKLLDDAFVFHFSPLDFQNGKVDVEQWDRASELTATANIFNPAFSPPNGSPISSIDLTLTYPNGEDVWNIVSPDENHQGETWYEKTVDYFLTVVAGETTYTSGNPIKASFTVRWGKDPDGNEFWRVVSWRDDIGN